MTVCVGSAYCIACSIRWHHRYVISEVNPDYWGSREAGRAVIDVGDKIVAEALVQESLDMLLPQRFEVEELPATKEGAEGWHRARQVSRVGSGQVARKYVYKPRVQRPRTVLRLFDALGLCETPPGLEVVPAVVAEDEASRKEAAPPRPRPPKVAEFATTLRLSVRAAPSLRAKRRGGPSQGRSAPPRRCTDPPCGFELYAGSGRITGALGGIGVCVRPAMEI